MIGLGIANDIPNLSRIYKRRKESRFVMFVWCIIALGIILWTAGIIYLIKR